MRDPPGLKVVSNKQHLVTAVAILLVVLLAILALWVSGQNKAHQPEILPTSPEGATPPLPNPPPEAHPRPIHEPE